MINLKSPGLFVPAILVSILAIVIFACQPGACAPSPAPPIRDLYSDTWVASDALGRFTPSMDVPIGPRADRTVGVFYFLWHREPNYPIYDITQLLAANPANPQYGPVTAWHWWGQPWLGYYQADDPAVIRKHMQMLANAGVDVIVCDSTNGAPYTYPIVREAVCTVLTQMRAEGLATPKIAFITNESAAQKVYEDFYAKNQYPDLWFRWHGKPLMMVNCGGSTDHLSPEVRSFFTLRRSWAWSGRQGWFGDGRDAWPWLDNYPQNYGWHDDPAKPEEVSVVVAQHATTSIGRSFQNGHEPAVDARHVTPDSDKGIYFDEQFGRALKIDPQFVFITGWNEWTAQRFVSPKPGRMAGADYQAGGTFFVDEYNEEFSRDIEPARGRLGDNYYYQFVNSIRRYKGARSLLPVTKRTIHFEKGFGQWATVQPEFRAAGCGTHRDFPGWGKTHYTNLGGRNEITTARVAYDKDNVYFYARTKEAITSSTDPSWMLLFINSDANLKTGWLGYDFVVNQSGIGSKQTTLSANVGGGYSWTPVKKVAYRVAGDEIEIAIPRAALGIKSLSATLMIKWADNIEQNGDVSDFTLNGACAPDDRFNYLVKLGGKN